MEIMSDASAFLAVVLNEIDRDWVIENTSGFSIVSPEVLPYEIGNVRYDMRYGVNSSLLTYQLRMC